MKLKRSIAFLVFVFSLTLTLHVSAKEEPVYIENFDVEITITDKSKGVTYTLKPGVENIKINTSGNYKRSIEFDLEIGDDFLNLANAYAKVSISLQADVDNDGTTEDISLRDKNVVITKKGKVKLEFRYNGK